jgi:VanZ family protein
MGKRRKSKIMIKISSMVTERKKVSFREIISYWLPPVAYMALIFYMSSKPVPEGLFPEIWNIDKAMHSIEYGILGFLWLRAIKNKKKIQHAASIAFTISFLYGISDEIHQYFVPNRSSSVYDVIADGIGAWVGIWLYTRRV